MFKNAILRSLIFIIIIHIIISVVCQDKLQNIKQAVHIIETDLETAEYDYQELLAEYDGGIQQDSKNEDNVIQEERLTHLETRISSLENKLLKYQTRKSSYERFTRYWNIFGIILSTGALSTVFINPSFRKKKLKQRNLKK